MKHTLKKLLISSLVLIIAFSPMLFRQNVVAQALPKIYVEPADNIYYTDTTSVGLEFTVSIMAADWSAPGVFGHQFTLVYDNTMLEAVAAGVPEGHWLTPVDPTKGFLVDGGTINHEAGSVSFAFTMLAPEEGKTGGGTLATVTLRITAAPSPGQTLSCALELDEVIMVDPNADKIPPANYELIHGYFEFSLPPPPMYLKVEPSKVTASMVGDEVSIRIMIYDAEADLKIISVQFQLYFPSAFLKVTEVTEGDFFQSFGTTFFTALVETGYVVGFVFLLPITQLPPTFPVVDGDGVVVNIKFDVIGLPEVLTEFPLELDDQFTFAIDEDSNIVLPLRLEDAVFLAPTKLEDINSDGNVDIGDMVIWAVAFGSYPGHPEWDSRADIDQNEKINILDGVLIAVAFGK